MDKDTIFLVKTVYNASLMITDDFFIACKDEHGDLVTNFDLEIERYLIDKINESYPTFDIISEEFNPMNELTKNCFVIDPVDGTINFAHGLPLWGIQVAMIKNGKPVVAIIYLPKLGELFYANETGAYIIERPTGCEDEILTKSKKISVSKTESNRALYLVEGGDKFPALGRMNKDVSRHWRYYCCTAVNHAWTACGRLGGAILRKDNVWDYLPGQYLTKQAGGVVINKKGAHVVANSKEMAKLLVKKGKL
ncbi:MAG: inositol monophosphatase [Firmicutes bacterium]|nr:inositol monophosphatase [Bacillota bacterium]